MKRFLILTCVALLFACHSLAESSFTPTLRKITPSLLQSSTNTFTPTPTETPIPSETFMQVPPQFFNPALVRTFTPSPQAQCPKENPNLEFDVERNQYLTEYILDFLNSGGTLKTISSAFDKRYSGQTNSFLQTQDLTGDRVPELVISYGIWINIFGCRNGQYELKFADTYESDLNGVFILDVTDINKDGLADVIVYFSGCLGNRCPIIRIYEWNGKDFQNLIANPSDTDNGCSSLSVAPFEVKIQDTDNNDTKEIILSNNRLPQPDNDFPYRKETRTCMWNGQNILVYKSVFDAPYYRFQAVQDGDRAVLSGDYEKALGFYQRTINDKSLEWFTQDRKWHDFWIYHSEYFPSFNEPIPTASPSMQQDPNEYPVLAAYAYYRIMLVHVLQHDRVKAESKLNTLQKDFPMESPGNYFTQVASVFWQEYQLSMNVQNSCQKVVDYVQQYPLPTEYLGDWDHGVHSIDYTAEAICPFK